MRDKCAGLAIMPDYAEDWMLEEGIREAFAHVAAAVLAEGATIIGPLMVRLMRHQPGFDAAGNLTGHHDAVRVLVECERPDPVVVR